MKGRRQASEKGGRGEEGREGEEMRFNFFIPQHSTDEVTAHIYQFTPSMLPYIS